MKSFEFFNLLIVLEIQVFFGDRWERCMRILLSYQIYRCIERDKFFKRQDVVAHSKWTGRKENCPEYYDD